MQDHGFDSLCGSHHLPGISKILCTSKSRENFCLSCETDAAAISF